MDIAEVIAVGPKWNQVRLTDGRTVTLTGNYNWRSNNPGNIEWGEFARSQGAIGVGAVPPGRQRGFAIFPTLAIGDQAREALQFESPSYAGLTVRQAIARYAPEFENDVGAYVNTVTNAAGVSPDTLMSDLTPTQRAAFMDAQRSHEGWQEGTITNEQGVRLPPGDIPSTSGTSPRVQAGNAPLFRFDSMGNPVNAETGERVLGSDPAYSHLMAFQEASGNVRPPRVAPTPAPASQRPGSNAQPSAPGARLPEIGPTGGPSLDGTTRTAPIPQEMPRSVANTRAQNETLTARLAQADADEIAASTSDPVGAMPAFSALGSLTRPAQSLGGSGVTRTAGLAGTVAMPPGARPNVPSTDVSGVDDIGDMPTHAQFRTLMRPVQVENPAYNQALSARARIPLGEVVHTGSRDTVAQRAAGENMARNMPPRWITRMQAVQVPVTPARRVAQQQAPLSIGVQGGSARPSIVQQFRLQGMSPSAAYAAAAAAANRPTNAFERGQISAGSQNSNTAQSISTI